MVLIVVDEFQLDLFICLLGPEWVDFITMPVWADFRPSFFRAICMLRLTFAACKKNMRWIWFNKWALNSILNGFLFTEVGLITNKDDLTLRLWVLFDQVNPSWAMSECICLSHIEDYNRTNCIPKVLCACHFFFPLVCWQIPQLQQQSFPIRHR